MYFCSFFIKIYISVTKTIVDYNTVTDPKTGKSHSEKQVSKKNWKEERLKTANIFIKKDGSYLFYENMREYHYNNATFTFERNKEFTFCKSEVVPSSGEDTTEYEPYDIDDIVVYNAH